MQHLYGPPFKNTSGRDQMAQVRNLDVILYYNKSEQQLNGKIPKFSHLAQRVLADYTALMGPSRLITFFFLTILASHFAKPIKPQAVLSPIFSPFSLFHLFQSVDAASSALFVLSNQPTII